MFGKRLYTVTTCTYEKKMKNRISAALMAICLLAISGCADTARPEVALDPIVNEDGIYVFPGYEWWTEKADLERQLGYALDKSYNTEFLADDGSVPVDGNNAMMMADDENRWHTIEGTPFHAAYLFREGKLISIEFGHDNYDYDNRKTVTDFVNYPRLAKKIITAIKTQLGEPDMKYDAEESEERPFPVSADTELAYLWRNEEADTVNWVSVHYSIVNGISRITIIATKGPA